MVSHKALDDITVISNYVVISTRNNFH